MGARPGEPRTQRQAQPDREPEQEAAGEGVREGGGARRQGPAGQTLAFFLDGMGTTGRP